MSDTAGSLRALLRRALFLRIVVAVGLHLFTSEGTFAPDQETYHHFGAALARYWGGEDLVMPPKLREPGPKAYYYIVAGLYFIFGPYSLVPKMVNAMVGTLAVGVLFRLVRRLTGEERTALRATALAAYFPSLVLWSALNIRDTWIILLILVICNEATGLRQEMRLRGLIMLAGSVLLLVSFRDYVLFAITLPMVVSFFALGRGTHLGRNVLLGMLAVVVVVYADRAAGSERKLRGFDLEQLQEIRYWNRVGAASQFEAADISTPAKAVLFLPKGLVFFLLAPFPWMLGSVRQILALPEMLVFYSLLPSMFVGLKLLIRHRLRESLMVLLVSGALTIGYALGEGNAGTAYRHRAQLLCFYLGFAAVGLEARRAAREQSSTALTPVSEAVA